VRKPRLVELWELPSLTEWPSPQGHPGGATEVAFSPDGHILASSMSDGTIKLWDVVSGKLKASLEGHSADVWSVAFSPDGQTLASGSADNTIKLWDVKSGQEKTGWNAHSADVWSVAFSPGGLTLASSSADTTVKLWDWRELCTPVTPDLYQYLEEGWCQFDPDTDELIWNQAPRNPVLAMERPFHNLPQSSYVAILRRTGLEPGRQELASLPQDPRG